MRGRGTQRLILQPSADSSSNIVFHGSWWLFLDIPDPALSDSQFILFSVFFVLLGLIDTIPLSRNRCKSL
jgi:hypothetical protein